MYAINLQDKAEDCSRVEPAVGSPRSGGQPVVAWFEEGELGDGDGSEEAGLVLCVSFPLLHLFCAVLTFPSPAVPIQASPTPDDGLSYLPNPRFSKEGFWMQRKDWPVELR